MTYPVEFMFIVLASIALAGLLQAVLGWAAVVRFTRRPRPHTRHLPPITVLKPLHGDEPLLEAALASICTQDYPRFQIVFGLQDAADPALSVLIRLRRRFPDLDMAVVVDPTPHGANRKVGNLINMLGQARHDLLVIADSDMHVEPGFLRRIAAAFRPGTGLVTTIYAGHPANGSFAARMGSAYINHTFLPGALLARALGRQDCLGATMAVSRTTLDRVGGLEVLADELADDAVLGALVRRAGLRVSLADTVPATTVPETQVPPLFEHELRWARTIRSVAPVAFALSAVQFPLFWAALAVGVGHGECWAWMLFLSIWLARGLLCVSIDRRLGLGRSVSFWALPFRDLLSVTVLLASYGSSRVSWRGQILGAKPAPGPAALDADRRAALGKG